MLFRNDDLASVLDTFRFAVERKSLSEFQVLFHKRGPGASHHNDLCIQCRVAFESFCDEAASSTRLQSIIRSSSYSLSL